MIPYWLLLIPFAIAALGERSAPVAVRRPLGLKGGLLVALLTIVVGYRYEVGGDWYNYLRMFSLSLAGYPFQ